MQDLISFWLKDLKTKSVLLMETWNTVPPAGVRYHEHIAIVADVFDKIHKEFPKALFKVKAGRHVYAILQVNVPGVEQLSNSLLYKGHEYVLDNELDPMELVYLK